MAVRLDPFRTIVNVGWPTPGLFALFGCAFEDPFIIDQMMILVDPDVGGESFDGTLGKDTSDLENWKEIAYFNSMLTSGNHLPDGDDTAWGGAFFLNLATLLKLYPGELNLNPLRIGIRINTGSTDVHPPQAGRIRSAVYDGDAYPALFEFLNTAPGNYLAGLGIDAMLEEITTFGHTAPAPIVPNVDVATFSNSGEFDAAFWQWDVAHRRDDPPELPFFE